jgi:hypothetical protein
MALTVSKMTRIFQFQGIRLPDPNPAMTVDEVKALYAAQYFAGDGKSSDVSRVFLALEPDSAGYVILGPTLRLLEGFHPRLPVTFLHLFLGRLTDGFASTTTGTHLIVSKGFVTGMNRTRTARRWNCLISIVACPRR